MPTEWFYKHGDQTIGPVSPKELLAKVREGEIQAQTQVKKDDSQWVEASEVGGLLDAAAKGSTYRCPHCGEQISKPPSNCRKCSRWIDQNDGEQVPAKQQAKTAQSRTPKVIRRVSTWVRSLMNEDGE